MKLDPAPRFDKVFYKGANNMTETAIKSDDECSQDCLWNRLGRCAMYREPKWKEFGTPECKEETDKMREDENE